eukprot:TRINITY_DN7003_c0_g1_i1.p1 TRINITY_DN7003_c0_g1~~TRINITY_DN7003_c0_g1_i1.p1  ORF type:complete len:465 (-),score=81.10 TRINITY_DN7003_c0_g1_i1:67-1461(-)
MKYLCHFAHSHPDFRMAELESLVSFFEGKFSYDKEEAKHVSSFAIADDTPFLVVEMEDEELARKVCSRSMTLRAIYELSAIVQTYEELAKELLHQNFDFVDGKTWKIGLEAFGRSYSTFQQQELLEKMRHIDLWNHGKISLKDPDIVFGILEDVGSQRTFDAPTRKIYFGRKIADGQRDSIHKYKLNSRTFLGTTAMDPELSLITANMANSNPASLIYDPFVGTGSFLIACAHFGAVTLGADIDVRTVKDLSGAGVEGNMKQYNFSGQYEGIVLCDASRPPWRLVPFLDAIVTDLPYGIRAGARKVGKKKNKKYKPVPEGLTAAHFPQCVQYDVPDVVEDLISFAAQTLVKGGRLVFWLPTTPEFQVTDIPEHPCLELFSHSLQPLTLRWNRRLITMVKTRDYNEEVVNLLNENNNNSKHPVAHSDLRSKVFWRPRKDHSISSPVSFDPEDQSSSSSSTSISGS